MSPRRASRRAAACIRCVLRSRGASAGAAAWIMALAAAEAGSAGPLAPPTSPPPAQSDPVAAPTSPRRSEPSAPSREPEVEDSASEPADAGPAAPPEAPELPADLPPEVRQRIIEAAIVEALRARLYFSDSIRERLLRDESIRREVTAAALTLRLDPDESMAALRRADTPEGRRSLETLLPERDDPELIRRLVHLDLQRAAAPLQGEAAMDDHSRRILIAAAVRLLVEQMDLPGGRAIWGRVDAEVDRKIRLIVASRAPRPQRRAWCELAAWTLLVQGLDERALGVALESAKWLSNAQQPPSADFAAVHVLAAKSLGLTQDAARLRAEDPALATAPPELRERLDRALRR